MNTTTTQILIPSVAMKNSNDRAYILWQDGGLTVAHLTTDAADNEIIIEQLLSPDQTRALRNFLNSQVGRDTLHVK